MTEHTMQLTHWLETGAADTTRDIRAFAFNLFELGPNQPGKFAIEWIGADQYDKKNPDWACEEVWSSSPRVLTLPVSLTGETWESCGAGVKAALVEAIAALPADHVLKGGLPVALGGEQMDLALIQVGNGK
ncbi:hypothetical protein KSF73_06245 [Burkholderiaceae bacterium DAT-1]|nr:hypothetical protein [Burkholderiaceae bacterium DAT-1]